MARFDIEPEYLTRFLVDLLNTPSPTGDTEYAISLIEAELQDLGVKTSLTRKGALIAHLDGLQKGAKRGITAHVDTLGAIVAEVKSNGRLRLKAVGGLNWAAVESEGVTLSTQSGRQVRGSLILANGAAHVNKEAHTAKRDSDSMEVRLDERTQSAEETRLLGIEVGDFVSFDPRVETSRSGFIRSRFLDDKACVAAILAAIKVLADGGLKAAFPTTIVFSNHEEVGHGGVDGLPADLDELLVLDMGCIGVGQNGDEFHCSIGMADGAGPYHKQFSRRIRAIAERRGIDMRPDIYPYYSSDGTAYSRAGGSACVALIGPGIDTSHAYERTHIDAITDTAQMVAEYLVDEG